KTENSQGFNDYWIMKITENYNTITGKVFIDLNNNSVLDAGELTLKNQTIYEINSGNFALTANFGEYKLNVFDTGSYIVSTANLTHYLLVPMSHSLFFSGFLNLDSLNDFAFQPNG